MTDFSKWVSRGLCDHCGKPILMRPAKSRSTITVIGCEPMEYVHEDMTTECRVVSVGRAKPYSDIGDFSEWQQVMISWEKANETKR